jgi:NAD(P)H-dependent FMN reductase
MSTVSIIIGSTREGRFGDKPAVWLRGHLEAYDNVTVKLLDLRDFPMPFFDQMVPPGMPGRTPYTDAVVQRWTAAIAESDAFVVVAAEYNYGPPAVLKNAMDWVYAEWRRKPISFVSYGTASGVRSVQQLRDTAVELQMAPIRNTVQLPPTTLRAHFSGGDVGAALTTSDADASRMIDDLLWWTDALKAARAKGKS